MEKNRIIILDFGGHYSQIIAREIRAQSVYCEVLPYTVTVDEVVDKEPLGLILAGGIPSIHGAKIDPAIYGLGIPILAFGHGSRAMLSQLGGSYHSVAIENAVAVTSLKPIPLFEGVADSERYYDFAAQLKLPAEFEPVSEAIGTITGYADQTRNFYGLQFHPQSNDLEGLRILSTFVLSICEAKPWWTMPAFINQSVIEIRETVGDGSVLCAMSGGVDSSVCAALVHKAIGKQLYCLFVDTGLMRMGEGEDVERIFKDEMGMNLIRIDAKERFLERLKGITDPEEKRIIIGEEFIRVFEEEAKKIGAVDFLVQGTIYPDVIESYGIGGVIKSHHNVGGLPQNIDFKELIEPVRELFKDEVRQLGECLGLPPKIIWRQPFPGPGLAVRVLGEVTNEKLDLLREADAIFRDEIAKAGLERKIWQYFVILTDMRSVGISENLRTYGYTAALRAVHSVDAMTASSARLPYDLLERVVERITSEISEITRVVFDITPKPPATIEWE